MKCLFSAVILQGRMQGALHVSLWINLVLCGGRALAYKDKAMPFRPCNEVFKDEEIAPLFADALNIGNIILPETFDKILRTPSLKSDKRPDVKRFLEAQNREYAGYKQALEEVRSGRKRTHWIWYIFPQVKGLGYSQMANFYGIKDREEGEDYLLHPTLNDRIHEISSALLQHKGKAAIDIFGSIDSMKVRSSMTLFDELSPNDVFGKVLDTFFNGERDQRTIELLDKE